MPICSRSSSLARRFTSGSARFRRVTISGTVSARKAYTRDRESSAAMISNDGFRSEEHTSELQSLRHLVCRLLLEKKKKVDPCGGASHDWKCHVCSLADRILG